ncbi:uncharacterized protein J3R85_011299 [Psidium guajava]|nr:uncharacterized protein J3R85_011299 [Psidium guajava]
MKCILSLATNKIPFMNLGTPIIMSFCDNLHTYKQVICFLVRMNPN